MNVVRTKSLRANVLPRGVKSEGVQPAKVNLYQEIPNVEVSLDDFEEFALDRLKVRTPSRKLFDDFPYHPHTLLSAHRK